VNNNMEIVLVSLHVVMGLVLSFKIL